MSADCFDDDRPINDDPPWTERDSIDEDRERLEDRGAYDFDGLGYSTDFTNHGEWA